MRSEGMREQTFLILVALAEGPVHGYRVMKRVAELSTGQVRLGAGTLYGALDRLTEQGWVGVEREAVESGRMRRYYVLTRTGRSVLAAEAIRREELAKAVRRSMGRLVPRPAPAGGHA